MKIQEVKRRVLLDERIITLKHKYNKQYPGFDFDAQINESIDNLYPSNRENDDIVEKVVTFLVDILSTILDNYLSSTSKPGFFKTIFLKLFKKKKQ